MKKNIFNISMGVLRSNLVLAISAAAVLVSCTIQTGGYTDTDGIYYDPNRDTLPEGAMVANSGNTVGNYYDYQNTYYPTSDQNQIVYEKYKDWDGNSSNYTNSDWGNYTGSETNYFSSSWGYPYYGWGNPYSSFGIGFGFGWGSWGWYNPYYSWNMGWYGGYSPWYGGYYSPWYGGFYSPWYGGGYYGGYYPYYNNKYYGNSYNAPGFKRSGAVGNGFRSVANGGRIQTNLGMTGTRSQSGTRLGNQGNGGFRNNTGVQPRPTFNNNGGRYQNTPRPQQPNYNNDGYRGNSNGGGFRSGSNGGFNQGGNSGGFRSGNSGGGFNSSGGGGMRSSGGGSGFRR